MSFELRAEKTTQNKDDLRVLLVGSVITIFMLLTIPLIGQGHDKFFAQRPFMKATVEVVQTIHRERPVILYDADATQLVDATWIVSILSEKREQIFTRRGVGAYTDKIDNPRPWRWSAFFDNEMGFPAPDVPNEPFYVCVRYVSYARDSGIDDESPLYCSNLFYPDAPAIDLRTRGMMIP